MIILSKLKKGRKRLDLGRVRSTAYCPKIQKLVFLTPSRPSYTTCATRMASPQPNLELRFGRLAAEQVII